MGKALYESSEIARHIFDTASAISDVDLPEVCWGGDFNRLSETVVAQPAIAADVMARYFSLYEKGLTPNVGEGHSAGEIALLGMAKVLSIPDTFTVIRARAEAMLHAHKKRPGKMAVVKISREQLKQSIPHLLKSNRFSWANLNSKTQQVVSGDDHLIEKALETWSALKIKARALPIQIAAHSPYHMEPGVRPFGKALDRVEISHPEFDIMLNNALYLSEIGTNSLKEYLKGQLVRGVDFEGGTNRLYSDGIRRFYDLGATQALGKLVKSDYGDSVVVVSENELLEKLEQNTLQTG
jgi:[acyl-carrier-protein] S-malonyltransferase